MRGWKDALFLLLVFLKKKGLPFFTAGGSVVKNPLARQETHLQCSRRGSDPRVRKTP